MNYKLDVHSNVYKRYTQCWVCHMYIHILQTVVCMNMIHDTVYRAHLLYSCCSSENMCLLKYSCSFSLAKLMLNCSNLFTSKFSKPKISRIPMKAKASLPVREICSIRGGGRGGGGGSGFFLFFLISYSML